MRLPPYLWLAAVLLLTTTAAHAQIEASSPASQRAANRRALREARRTDAPYKDSHLDVSRHPQRPGDSAPIKPAMSEPRFDRDGTSHVSEPKRLGLRLRKRKTSSDQ
jgi:hypothetical protein